MLDGQPRELLPNSPKEGGEVAPAEKHDPLRAVGGLSLDDRLDRIEEELSAAKKEIADLRRWQSFMIGAAASSSGIVGWALSAWLRQ